MCRIKEIKLSDITRLPIDDQFKTGINIAYMQYENATKKLLHYQDLDTIILTLTDFSAMMFDCAWNALKEKNIKLWKKNIEYYQNIFRDFLIEQGYESARSPNTACYGFLFACFKNEKKTKIILKRVYENLRNKKVIMSNNEYERGLQPKNYPTFQKFFGKAYKTISNW